MPQKLIYIGQNNDLALNIKKHLSIKGLALEYFLEIDAAKEALKNGHIGAIIDVRNQNTYSQEDIINEHYQKIIDIRNKNVFPVMGILSGEEEQGYNFQNEQKGLWISYTPIDKRDIDTFVKYALGYLNKSHN